MLVHRRDLILLIFITIPLILLPTTLRTLATNWLMLAIARPPIINYVFSHATISTVLLSAAQPPARGHVFLQVNELEQAMNAWEDATRLDPMNPVNKFWWGNVAAQLRYSEKAIDAWRRAQSSRYWAWQSAHAAQENRYATAHQLAKRATLINPGDRDTQFIVGEMYFHTKNWEQAIESLSVVLESQKQDTQFYRALMLRGQAYMEMPDSLDRAYEDLTRASRLHSQDPWPHIRLCQVFGLMHKPEEALSACKRAANLAEDSAFAHYYLGWAFFLNNQFASAAAEFERSLELDSNLLAAQEWLAKTQNRK